MSDFGLERYGVDYEAVPQEQPFLIDAAGDSLDNDIALPDTPVELKLRISSSQYTKLLSSALNGALRFYGDEYIDVIYPLIKAAKEYAMSCADVADCIENDTDVLNALLNFLAANGYSQNPESASASPTETLSPARSGMGLLPGDMDCSDHAQNMAVARQIVRELNESVEDALEALELATNASEALAISTDSVPFASVGSDALEFANWMQETVAEVYQAAYSQESEDEIACAIYCHIEAECEISLDSLLSIYEDLASITVPTITTFDDLINFVVDTTMSADTTGVALFQYFLLRGLKFGGAMFELAGFNDLAAIIKTAATYRDYSYENCDECPPDDEVKNFWRILQDGAVGAGEFEVDTSANWGSYDGSGWLTGANTGSLAAVRVGDKDFGAAYDIYGLSFEMQARGFAGVAGDLDNFALWAGANWTSTLTTPLTQAGLTANENDFRAGWYAAPSPAVGYRSARIQVNNVGAFSYPSNFAKVTKICIVGAAGAGNTKPSNAVWWRDTAPASVDDLWS